MIVTEKEFSNVIDANADIFEDLLNICRECNEPIEGNCFLEHGSGNLMPALRNKQINIFSLAKNAKEILEIGFNAGHSATLMLLANSKSKLVIFDICEHKYAKKCFEYLNKRFPNRMELYEGDSTVTVPKYSSKNYKLFDLVHIDGCHLPNIADTDFNNCYPMSSKYIIFDDTNDPILSELLDERIKRAMFYEVDILPTHYYEHRVVKVVNYMENTQYRWFHNKIEENGWIYFKRDGILETSWGNGRYLYIGESMVQAEFCGQKHMLFLYSDSEFMSVRGDMHLSTGIKTII